MLPISVLMVEHRIIERMIKIIEKESQKLKEGKELNPIFIDTAVDFIRTYADQTHHGKEEDILFRDLGKKELKPEHKKIMEELVEEHKLARKTTGDLLDAKVRFQKGDKSELNIILEKMNWLVEFYPKHIEKEDKHFFTPVMDYFSDEEKSKMLDEEHEFDMKMIHKKYDKLVSKLELDHNLTPPDRPKNWLDFI